jgi:hypothetical protein
MSAETANSARPSKVKQTKSTTLLNPAPNQTHRHPHPFTATPINKHTPPIQCTTLHHRSVSEKERKEIANRPRNYEINRIAPHTHTHKWQVTNAHIQDAHAYENPIIWDQKHQQEKQSRSHKVFNLMPPAVAPLTNTTKTHRSLLDSSFPRRTCKQQDLQPLHYRNSPQECTRRQFQSLSPPDSTPRRTRACCGQRRPANAEGAWCTLRAGCCRRAASACISGRTRA